VNVSGRDHVHDGRGCENGRGCEIESESGNDHASENGCVNDRGGGHDGRENGREENRSCWPT
jgi:hypothetical protein